MIFHALSPIKGSSSISSEEIDIDSIGFETLLEEGLEKYNNLLFEEAIVYFDKALAFEPDNQRLLNLKGLSLIKLGKYSHAITNYDKILDMDSKNIESLKNKAVALSKLERHTESIIELHKVLEINPRDVTAFNGMGLGFGNLGEYGDSIYYFEKALQIDPSNKIALAYKDYVTKVKAKYYPDQASIISLKEKEQIESKGQSVPSWIKNNAKWWSEDRIPQSDFIQGIQYLVQQNIIKVTFSPISEKKTNAVPDWVKNTAGWWADDIISDKEFLSSIEFLISNRIIQIESESSDSLVRNAESEIQLINEAFLKKHLFEVTRKIAEEKRYIEFPNPSWALKKKYLRDVEQWNLGQQIETGLHGIPNPTYTEEDGMLIGHYKIYINDQPPGLPFDYKPTLDESLDFWESQNFTLNEKPLVFDFSYTDLKSDGNVWVTWIVRDIEALGHATLGKGVVEVTIGNYACNGDFELLDMDTVEYIMKHEIGHSIGLPHSSDPDSIMYPSVDPSYGFCIISDKLGNG